MDIKELQDYRLSDAIKFHSNLNPKIWGPDEHLLPEVREKLLAIADDFKEFLGLDLEVKDITISGSNAAYTYTDHSDIDLHLVADLPRADASDVYRELFDAKKYQYNDQHNYKIGGYDVELYVQNANQDPKSQGIYSVLDNKWISVPKRRKPDVDDISVKSKYEDLGRRIEAAIQSGDAAQLETLGKKVREFRQAGLDQTGEFGPENLAFKILRSNGTLDQLRAARLAAKDQAMSLNEKKKKPKNKKRYGSFGGMFFPGYHYYGQTDAAVDGGSDGGESVKESTDSVDTQLQNFVKFCADKLELEQIPRIQIKRDPEWSRRNSSFGRYIPDADTLIVSVANRHPMDVMRTMAHELTHRKQDEQADMPIGAGDTGSDWENQANAQAGVLMRDFAELHPEYFGKESISEASGYIPVNKKEARDPRYSMALTVDIKPGENQRQAAKMGWKTNPAGTPPTAKTNGLVEALTKKLQAVKEGLGFPLVSEQEQELEEVAMSPSALRAFAASPAAQGMQAGFEAELVFTGVNDNNNDESGEMEPDYDTDTLTRDIEGIMDFFVSGDMSDISSNSNSASFRRARSALEEDYYEWYSEHVIEEFSNDEEDLIEEWILENDWDQDEHIEEYLMDEFGLSSDEIAEINAAMERREAGKGTAADAELVEKYIEAEAGVKDQLEMRVMDARRENNSDYESALDEFRENYIGADESDWLRDRGWRYMSDIENNFDFGWPYWTRSGSDAEEGGFNPDVAKKLASSLSDALGVKTTVSGGYHGAKRDTSTWIFEPDGSLDSDDADNMPVEIVSPPMPLSKTLEILPKFFEWAEDNGAYANSSTGFHMSVSMPDHASDNLDYTKLALFLGDEYVLKQFGREANTYAKSALQKIREKKGNVNAETVMSAMRKHLDQFASRALASPSGFGKYTSINPKNNYIEFRSAGGSNYFEDMDKIQNTLMRYARAMNIAMDPAADKPEYAKKLYKMLTDVKTQQTTDPKTGTQRTEVVPGKDNDAISIFSRYVAGELPKSALKSFLKQIQYGREVAKNQSKEKIEWQVFQLRGSGSIMVMATSAEEAIKIAKQEYRDTTNPDDAYRAVPVLISPSEVPATQTPATNQMTAPAADDPGGNYVLRQREGNAGTGAVLHRFSAPNNMAAVEAARQWTTARGLERRSVWLDHVSGVPLDVLNARPVQATLGEPRPAFREPRTSSIPEVPLDIAQNFQEPPASWDSGSPIVSEPQNFPAARSPLGQWQVVNINTGEVVHEFRATNQQTANQHAEAWQNFTGFDDPVQVTPVAR